MSAIISCLALDSPLPQVDAGAIKDPKALLEAIESAQTPVADFRCECECAMSLNRPTEQKKSRVDETGLVQTSVGVFIWKRNGDISSDTIIREAVGGRLSREALKLREGVKTERRPACVGQTTAQSGIR